ncbi:hypothetical protein BRADI_1g61402v3 [Brachypodium distachyon]|uniref:Uncharacterized protein n=1 Tax=Brachypodium distachyon TaxID=15368 RepID=A0A0Q3S970_BRADI|nr:hypothetical protein BRADI_1g61402v3 [Brachypodium distachyon]
MGLPVEQWCGGEAEKKEASGCRTPSSNKAQQQAAGGGVGCPEPPRKRRPAPGPVSQQRNGDYYAGADVEAFFAAHNL